jgi:hypothetical protein
MLPTPDSRKAILPDNPGLLVAHRFLMNKPSRFFMACLSALERRWGCVMGTACLSGRIWHFLVGTCCCLVTGNLTADLWTILFNLLGI